MTDRELKENHRLLLAWYRIHRRELPWRVSRDPYRIWISEVMLQQTTVAAVIPYYERFLKRFPDLQSLAEADEPDVLHQWAGLGYYSRARNLHKAAKALAAKKEFPRTAEELLELPGFGPYTSRAVASIAFGDSVGVLDGNVIRVLSRLTGMKEPWWQREGRERLQNLSDQLALKGNPDEINQALMELGATVCTPSSPACLLCPWNKTCVARAEGLTQVLPLKRPRRETEIWVWRPQVSLQKGRVALIQNTAGPVLKGQWLFPGEFRREKKKPKRFDARHGITHHDIYIIIDRQARTASKELRWTPVRDLAKINPSRILQKVLEVES